jgi:heme exporter protein A
MTMPDITLEAAGLCMTFNRRAIFRDVAFRVAAGQTMLVTGRNGSGKSTLVKIIAGVLTPSKGTITRRGAGLGLVSPYLQLFDEFSARENLALGAGLRGEHYDAARGDELLSFVGLNPDRPDPIRTYSSGMKQRVKYAFAMLNAPGTLILDEPMSNLDHDGTDMVRRVMAAQREKGILIIATNDLTDVDAWEARVDLNVLS